MSLNKKSLKSWGLVVAFAFLLNLIWENAHSVFYTHYKGGSITELHLIRAAFVDAGLILLMSYIAHSLPIYFPYKLLVIFIIGLLIAIGIEVWALNIGRWAYDSAMPIIPLLKSGLTPTVQLGLLGVLSYSLVFRKSKN